MKPGNLYVYSEATMKIPGTFIPQMTLDESFEKKDGKLWVPVWSFQ